jgi:hypothetical protein
MPNTLVPRAVRDADYPFHHNHFGCSMPRLVASHWDRAACLGLAVLATPTLHVPINFPGCPPNSRCATEQHGASMLCANPHCAKELLYLREGRPGLR